MRGKSKTLAFFLSIFTSSTILVQMRYKNVPNKDCRTITNCIRLTDHHRRFVLELKRGVVGYNFQFWRPTFL